MLPIISAADLRIIQGDYEQIVAGPESTPVILEYSVLSNQGQGVEIDAVYRIDNRGVSPDLVRLETRALQQIVSEENLKTYPFGFIKKGDAIFYFSLDINFQEPLTSIPAVPGSLRIKDAANLRWIPYTQTLEQAAKQAKLWLGNLQYGQAVPCYTE